MNKNLILFFIGTKLQSLVAALYKFGFLIIFYQTTNSLIYSSILTALTIIVSRATLILVIPHLKKNQPVKISILMNMLIGIIALVSIYLYPFWNEKIYGYFIIAIIFSILEEIDNSFQYSVIPNIVEKKYLFKANSLSAILTNINLIVAPLGSYIFYIYSDLRGFLLIYSIICFGSCIILNMMDMSFYKSSKEEKDKKKKSIFWSEWSNTFKIIVENSDILFCISIGVVINLIFAGLNGAVLLKMGDITKNQVFGQTAIKIVLSIGSLLGVSGVYKLKVKENYNKYLHISIVGLIFILLSLAFSHNVLLIYVEFLFLAIFIMFIMNSTGTFLQMATPKHELPAIYAFRSTLYAIVVPVSYIISGTILEYFDRKYYFIFSCFLIVIITLFKILSKNQFSQNIKSST